MKYTICTFIDLRRSFKGLYFLTQENILATCINLLADIKDVFISNYPYHCNTFPKGGLGALYRVRMRQCCDGFLISVSFVWTNRTMGKVTLLTKGLFSGIGN